MYGFLPKRKSQAGHDSMVRQVVALLIEGGYKDIKADLPGFTQPVQISWVKGGGHIPDVTARGDGFCLFEVETGDSIGHEHTADQWKLFAAYTGKHGAVFYVVVPKNGRGIALSRLSNLGITAEVLEV